MQVYPSVAIKQTYVNAPSLNSTAESPDVYIFKKKDKLNKNTSCVLRTLQQ